jgi:hypothetical protein
MPSFDCEYDGDIEIPDSLICEETSICPAYQEDDRPEEND